MPEEVRETEGAVVLLEMVERQRQQIEFLAGILLAMGFDIVDLFGSLM